MKEDIKPINANFQRHGYWERYMGGKLWFRTVYINGKKNGFEEYYWNGKLTKNYYL